jgi:glycerol-3-phosphate dehydrogenase
MEFSFRSRKQSIDRFKSEPFDFLIVGGGITGAAVARDAATRGLKVAVVEKNDFAFGTSSRSSKLIHGGLRYLENFEFKLVFEALAERSLLLETSPHMVRPLPFFMPVYAGDSHGRSILSLGLWLYDLLALFRTPGFHHRLSKRRMEETIPFIEKQKLLGGFRYYDASMWDDVLAVQTLRSAYENGAAVANYVEAKQPIWTGDRITGFVVLDREAHQEIQIKAKKVISCVGPWTDTFGSTVDKNWKPWLSPSKGIHIVFDYKKIPLPGALVMSHPTDGRISFVIPRKDYGSGVVIVGTTDGPTPNDPDRAQVEKSDVEYLMALLDKYFPSLQLKTSDILSAYVGVRPLVGNLTGSEGQALQKVSREHHIDVGPGHTVVAAGGKYTTHRMMAQEIVEFALKEWKKEAKNQNSQGIEFPKNLKSPQTKNPINAHTTGPAVRRFRREMIEKKVLVPVELIERYGTEALEIMDEPHGQHTDPVGFPALASQLRYSIRHEMVLHLEDFYLRRLPLFLSREDHGLPWAEMLGKIWAEETGVDESISRKEIDRLNEEFSKRSAWKF